MIYFLVAMLLAFPTWAASITNPCGFNVIGFHDTGNSSERYTQVVLGTRPVVFELAVSVNPGDVLVVQAEGEITTPRNTNTEIVSRLEMFWNNTTYEISEENGENIDIDRHHHKLTGTGQIRVPAEVPPGASVYIWWRWGAFDGTIQPNYVWVGGGEGLLDYGRMTIQQYRPICS